MATSHEYPGACPSPSWQLFDSMILSVNRPELREALASARQSNALYHRPRRPSNRQPGRGICLCLQPNGRALIRLSAATDRRRGRGWPKTDLRFSRHSGAERRGWHSERD